MKPGFALSLSFEGISLLQRAAGGWRSIGEVSLDTGDLAGELARLRQKALGLGPGDMRCKVIIPNDQIRYLSLDTGSFSGDTRLSMVRQALDDATPYPVKDLAFDISVDGTTTHVAAVVRETLAEAEGFAVEHGFNPTSFVAAPGDNIFWGEPFFGASEHAATLPDAEDVEPDGIAVVVIGPVEMPVEDPERPPEPAASSSEPETDPQPALAGFSSRRGKAKAAETSETIDDTGSQSAAPSLGGANRHDPHQSAAIPAPVAFRSSQSRTDEDPEQEITPEPISVTAPTLDIPELNDPEREDTPEEAETSGIGAFLSRRKKTGRIEPESPSSPIPPAPAPLAEQDMPAAPSLTAVSRPVDAGYDSVAQAISQEDETARMTVFGAREHDKVGGKPRHLGLILSAALLLFLAAVAAWASIFLDDGIAGLFRPSPDKTELAAVPDTPGIGVKADDPAGVGISDATAPVQQPSEVITQDAEPGAPVVSAPLAQLPPDIQALPPPRHITEPADPGQQPASADLSDTDTAVLDALREAEPEPESDEDQAALEPAVQAPATELGTEPASTNRDGDGLTATGVLQSTPQVPDTPTIIGLDDLYVASIDRTDLSQDAIALPLTSTFATDLPLGAVNSPVAAGTAFDLDASGLVVATVEGTLNPDGVIVYLGRPAVVPPGVPARLETQPETDAAIDRLAGLRPRLRPDDLEERFERSNLGGLTRAELGGLRPKARPESLQQEVEQDSAPTAQAVVSSRVPRARPGNMATIVSAAVRPAAAPDNSGNGSEQVATVAPATVSPKIPSSASVARQATLKNEINLRRVNLIGVYGTPSNRRALVRLPSGRYKKVKVGDTVDGGRVVAIGDSELRYQKSGRSTTLKIPSS